MLFLQQFVTLWTKSVCHSYTNLEFFHKSAGLFKISFMINEFANQNNSTYQELPIKPTVFTRKCFTSSYTLNQTTNEILEFTNLFTYLIFFFIYQYLFICLLFVGICIPLIDLLFHVILFTDYLILFNITSVRNKPMYLDLEIKLFLPPKAIYVILSQHKIDSIKSNYNNI